MLEIISQTEITDFEKGPIRRSLFSNGAMSFFHKAEGFVGAKVSLNFIAGSMFENENEHGLSHVIEHLVFKENGSEIVKELEMLGAQINAYTYKESVCFEMDCLSRNLESFLPKFFELFFKLDFTPLQLEKEKKVILQELKEDMDDHETYGLEYIFEKNFNENIGHPIGGKPKDVKRYTENDVKKYHTKFYSPERMILTIVSGEEFNEFESILSTSLKKHFKHKKRKPYRLKAQKKFKPVNHFKSKLKRKCESSILMFSFDAPSLNHKSYYDMAILDELLFDGLSSIFFKELREVTPLVYGLGSSINSYKDIGNYVMVFNTHKKNLKVLKAKVKEILKRYANEPFSDVELEAVKNKMLDAWELSFDSIDERASFISDNEMYQLDELSMKRVKENISNSSAKSIKNLVGLILKNNFSELVIESK